mgnify:CR=1 FL=1
MSRSPRKQRATIVKLAKKYGVPLETQELPIKRDRLGDITNLITEFYGMDAISRSNPSMKSASLKRSKATA